MYNEKQKKMLSEIYGSFENYEKEIAYFNAQKYLEETDYIVIKLKEYELTNREITDDYSEVFKKREEARKTIRNFAQK